MRQKPLPSQDAGSAVARPEANGPPFRHKLIYGSGQLADSLGLNGVKQIGNHFYVVLLGMSPAWIGTVLALIRIWDAILDPLLGMASDRLRSRYGRRKPLILAGAVGMGLLFPLLWLAQPEWTAGATIAWFTAVLLVFYVAYTCYSVPFQAMGLEMAGDYHQRTGIQAFRTFFGASSNLLVWWAVPLAFLPVFSSGVAGMVWIGGGIGVVILLAGLMPLFIPSRIDPAALPPPRGKGAGWRTVLSHRPFRLLLGAMGLTFLGINLAYGISGLLNVYFVYGGDVKASTVVTGAYGTLWTLASVAAAPLAAAVSRRIGKRATLVGCILSIATGSLLHLVVFQPETPYLQLLPVLFLSPGVAGLWVIGPSMLADVCDEDGVLFGEARQASFVAVYTWVQKLALSASFALSGYLTVWTGFDVGLAAAQAPGVYDRLRVVLAFTPFIALVPALACALRYPITETRARANRAELAGQAHPPRS